MSRHGLSPALSVRRMPRTSVPAPRLVEIVTDRAAANDPHAGVLSKLRVLTVSDWLALACAIAAVGATWSNR
jgi:hypothetical protein